jgi:hypothetical protein
MVAASATSLWLAATAWGAEVTKESCIDANAKAQDARHEGRFRDARALLKFCADPRCPNLVANDCTVRLDELEHAQPTVLFDVRDRTGHDIADVAVTVDGQVLTRTLTGIAFAVEPGHHTVVFEVAGQPAETRDVVLQEQEKGRVISVIVGAPPSPTGPARATPAAGDRPAPVQRTAGIVVGGVGLAGLVTGAVFGLLAASAKNDYEEHCGSSIKAPAGQCDSTGLSEHSDAATKATVSTVLFVGGGALTAAGLTLWFTGAPGGPRASVAVTPGGALLRGEF